MKYLYAVSQNKFIGNEMVQYLPVSYQPNDATSTHLHKHYLQASLGWYETGRYCTILLPANLFWLTTYAYFPNLFHTVWPCMAKLYLPFKSNKTGHVIQLFAVIEAGNSMFPSKLTHSIQVRKCLVILYYVLYYAKKANKIKLLKQSRELTS